MRSSVQLGQLFGINIGVHWSWLLIFALLTFTLATGFFPLQAPGLNPFAFWIMGAVAALLLFGAVLVHEMAHSLVARSQGMPVNSITLFLFGGVSNIQERAPQPKSELFMALVGPLTSLVIGGVLLALLPLIQGISQAIIAIVLYLGVVNILLGLFNLIPGFPLDGGRVLRAIVWWISNDRTTATKVASLVGVGIAWLLIFGGIFLAFTGNVIGGLWIVFIGWFLSRASGSRYAMVTREEEERRK